MFYTNLATNALRASYLMPLMVTYYLGQHETYNTIFLDLVKLLHIENYYRAFRQHC